jgi:hypothetical protein rflaF_12454
MDYIGEKCSACDKEITSDDDVVVCPECGSPHHRECYMKENKCAHEADHISGYRWKRTAAVEIKPEPEKRENPSVKTCSSCGFPNYGTSENCSRCGARLNETHNGASEGDSSGQNMENSRNASGNIFDGDYGSVLSYFGFDPKEDMGGATLEDVSQFVGSNTLYYIPIFKRMKDLGAKLSFNISCLIFPYFYFANRRMWLWAVIAAVINVIFSIPGALLYFAEYYKGTEGMEYFLNIIQDNLNWLSNLDIVFTMSYWIFSIVCCLFGNWLYYKFVMRSIKKLRYDDTAGGSSASKLAAAGGVKPINILMISLIMLGMALVGLYIAVSGMETLKTLKLFG